MWWVLALVGVIALGRRALGSGGVQIVSRVPPPAGAVNWEGWIWPVPIWQGREPVVTQEWKPGHDPGAGNASGAHENHLGVDIMFRKKSDDSKSDVLHDSQGSFISPSGTPVIAAGPGKIWATGYDPVYGHWVQVDHGTRPNVGPVNTFYQHLESFERQWRKDDPVEAGTLLGKMGWAPEDPKGLRHLHFEIWFPVKDQPLNTWRLDPQPYLNTFGKVVMK